MLFSLVFILAIYVVLWIPDNINETLDGLIYKLDDSSISIDSQIKIKGSVYKDIFLNQTFKGRVELSNLNEILVDETVSQLNEHDNLYIESKLENHQLHLLYKFYDPGCQAMRYLTVGTIYFDNGFKEVTLTLYDSDSNWNSSTGWMFSGPATDRTDAYNLSEVLIGIELD